MKNRKNSMLFLFMALATSIFATVTLSIMSPLQEAAAAKSSVISGSGIGTITCADGTGYQATSVFLPPRKVTR